MASVVVDGELKPYTHWEHGLFWDWFQDGRAMGPICPDVVFNTDVNVADPHWLGQFRDNVCSRCTAVSVMRAMAGGFPNAPSSGFTRLTCLCSINLRHCPMHAPPNSFIPLGQPIPEWKVLDGNGRWKPGMKATRHSKRRIG